MELVTPSIGLIFWQTLTFLIVLGVLAAFVWKPITEALRTRENFIADSLNAADKAKEQIQQLKDDNEYLLEEARLERDQMLKHATAIAQQIKADAQKETTKITAKMIEDAKAVITTEKNAALADVKNVVATLSIDIAEKILRKQLETENAQEQLVQDFIKDIKIN